MGKNKRRTTSTATLKDGRTQADAPLPETASGAKEQRRPVLSEFMALYNRHVEPIDKRSKPEPRTPAIERRLWRLILAVHAYYMLDGEYRAAFHVVSKWMPKLRDVSPQYDEALVEKKYEETARRLYEEMLGKDHNFAAQQFLESHPDFKRPPPDPKPDTT